MFYIEEITKVENFRKIYISQSRVEEVYGYTAGNNLPSIASYDAMPNGQIVR